VGDGLAPGCGGVIYARGVRSLQAAGLGSYRFVADSSPDFTNSDLLWAALTDTLILGKNIIRAFDYVLELCGVGIIWRKRDLALNGVRAGDGHRACRGPRCLGCRRGMEDAGVEDDFRATRS
jgi:hypothetical protein